MSNRTHLTLRIVLGVSLTASFFLWSFWVTLFLALLGLLFIPNYWEFFVVTVSIELLYQGGASDYPFILLYLPVIAIAVFFVVEVSRSFIREQVLRA